MRRSYPKLFQSQKSGRRLFLSTAPAALSLRWPCSASNAAWCPAAPAQDRRQNQPGEFDFYYLYIISYRKRSNEIADRFDVSHESPQILVIRNGACVYDESHMGISADDIIENLGTAA